MHHTRGRGVAPLTVLFLLAILVPIHLSTAESAHDWQQDDQALCNAVESLAFNGTFANDSVQYQVELGPRLPGSNVSLNFREDLKSLLEPAGWNITEVEHHRHGMNLTNFHARWASNATVTNGQVVISAHYDSRALADRDLNATNRTLPVPGANDAASGAAVLIELARHIPAMNLSYDVVLFWNDAEDQGENYTLGSKAWAENLSEAEIEATHAFVLLDMVGDADLQLQNILPGNDSLKARVLELGASLGMVSERTDCNGNPGEDIIQYDVLVPVLDDHVHPHELGIPSIDIMDPVYGEYKQYTFGTYWHTMEDTPDKVSAQSLERVGRLVELGLRTNAFVGLGDDDVDSAEASGNAPAPTEPNTTAQETSTPSGNPGLAILAATSLGVVICAIALLEFKGKP